MEKDKRNQWHPAFYGAMHLELKENKEDLEFTEEMILNTLPLRVDMLIVKKRHPCTIQNEIGRIFRKHNLIEYKSPEDSLNYDVFLKGIAYTYLYKSNETYMDEILLEDVTLSFIRERKPRKLFEKLRDEKFVIEEQWPGIYYIDKAGYIKIQVVVSKELSLESHIWLNSLSEKIDFQQVTRLIEITQTLDCLDDKNYSDSLWEVVASVNKETIQKAWEDKDMAAKALVEIMKPQIDEAFNDGRDEKGIRVFLNMIQDGMPRELAQKYAEISDTLVEKALAENR